MHKVELALGEPTDLRHTELVDDDSRHIHRLVRARDDCRERVPCREVDAGRRLAGKPPFYDTKFPGTCR